MEQQYESNFYIAAMQSISSLGAATIRDLVDEVGVDAVRYFFVMRSGETQMDFDLDLATKKSNENPV